MMIRNENVWLMAARPRTLIAAVAPVSIGTVLAYGDDAMHFFGALASLVFALLIQIGTNFVNDYCDFIKGVDNKYRRGPTRMMQAGLISRPDMFRGIVIVFFAASMVNIYLVALGGWPLIVIGIVSIIAAVFYTATPFSYGYYGWGDFFVLVFFGIIAVTATYYVQVHAIDWRVYLAGLAPGALSMAILSVNNLRDIKPDSFANKKTLAVRWGKEFIRWQYVASFVVAFCVPVILCCSHRGHYGVLVVFSLLFFAVRLINRLFTAYHMEDFSYLLAGTSKFLGLYALLFTIGWGIT